MGQAYLAQHASWFCSVALWWHIPPIPLILPDWRRGTAICRTSTFAPLLSLLLLGSRGCMMDEKFIERQNIYMKNFILPLCFFCCTQWIFTFFRKPGDFELTPLLGEGSVTMYISTLFCKPKYVTFSPYWPPAPVELWLGGRLKTWSLDGEEVGSLVFFCSLSSCFLSCVFFLFPR
jgi:hypothetical protein